MGAGRSGSPAGGPTGPDTGSTAPFGGSSVGAPLSTSSSRSLMTFNGRKFSRCWVRIHRSRSMSAS
jgi:hypothetical protein